MYGKGIFQLNIQQIFATSICVYLKMFLGYSCNFLDCDPLGWHRAVLYVDKNILEEYTACIFRFKVFRLKDSCFAHKSTTEESVWL